MNLASILTVVSLSLILYHFIGYPLILFCLSRIRPIQSQSAPCEPSVSLLIAAYNEEKLIVQKVASCMALDYPMDKLEIIIVSDGSTDSTSMIVDAYEHSNIRSIVHSERSGKSYALNQAAAAATGEILVISDANAMLEPQSLRYLVANFADPTIGCVSGSRQIMADDGSIKETAGLYWRYESAIKRWESKTGSTMGVLGSMLAVRRQLFSPIAPKIINDDFYIALCTLNQGQRVIYEPDARCWAYESKSIGQDRIRRRRISAGRFQHMISSFGWSRLSILDRIKLISHKYLRLFLLLFMVCGLLANVAVLLRPPILRLPWIILLAGQLLFYGIALLGGYLSSRGIRSPLPVIAYYILSGAVASFEGIIGYLSGTQTVLWHKANRSVDSKTLSST